MLANVYAAGTFEESDPQCLILHVFHAPGCASASCTLPSSVPLSLSASAVDSSDVYLEWSPMDDAVAYDISRDGTYVTTIDDAATTEYTDDSVSVIGHTTYDYTVTAVGWAGTLDTATASATTPDAAPVALDDGLNTDGSYNPNYIVAQNQTLTVSAANGVLANDTDADGDTLTVSDYTQPANGSVSVDSDGGFTYTPNTGYTGPDTFTYTADDGYGGTASATVNVDVGSLVANSQTFNMVGGDEDAYPGDQLTGTVTAADAFGGTPTCTVVGGNYNATVSIGYNNGTLSMEPDGSFTYIPDPGFIGTDTYTWQATDGSATSEPGTLTFNVSAPPLAASDLTIEVWAGGITYSGDDMEHGVINPELVNSGTDVLPWYGYGNGVEAVVDSQPADGTGEVDAASYGWWPYTDSHDPSTAANESFTYHLKLGGYVSNEAMVHVIVCPE